MEYELNLLIGFLAISSPFLLVALIGIINALWYIAQGKEIKKPKWL